MSLQSFLAQEKEIEKERWKKGKPDFILTGKKLTRICG
jgi:glucose-6-phosphate 1-dehydrogenase